ncbi:isopeptide-forming domain-containing fimbrial protein [Corynebacterium amycolatum]|uniref:SpaH/EbpB family LPXTG-anchored major pilin n=1 Tax=Corynebacterium amycolatum TaxID=43765 RepID=UPI0012B82615|nr:SpaH/EbpB family LPXTG-anchored major pilin [Corynebacterium amycolatum]KAA9267488.1 isopeptide-forming domain-containing fimbrial protein [Corynebacterium amycolatum]MBU5624201.1 SpaH/EbpB family LPXTG-anchored major pilin [Corynebacterium amycolatum]
MNKFSRTARSVTFAAIVGLSMGVSAPAAIAQDTAVNQAAGNSPLVNKDAKGSLTIHKFGNPTSEGQPSGTEADVQDVIANGGEKLAGVGFTVYKINKTADGATPIDVTTNEGLLAASKLKAGEFATGTQATQALIDNGTLTQVATGTTDQDGKWNVGQDLALGAYLVVETGPKEGYDPAVPFIAFVPMTSNGKVGDETQGTTWNYDVHAFPKNYKDEEPTKTVKDKDQNAGDKALVYTVTGTARQLKPNTERTQFQITDQIDPKLEVTKVDVKVVKADGTERALSETDDRDGKFFEGNNVDVNLKPDVAKTLGTGDKVVVTITTTLKPQFKEATDIAPNTGLVFQNNPDGSENSTPKETPKVKTYWGGVQFKKVDGDRNALEGAEFQIVRQAAGQKCSDIDTTKKDSWTPVNGQQGDEVKTTFVSGQDGIVKITGLHVNDFEDNAEVVEGEQSHYCLIETKAPKGKELLPEALEFKLVATSTDPERVYELASVQVGANAGEVVNSNDTTPNLPMTGGAGVGILAAIGAAIVAAGAWFARRGSKN